MNPGTLPLLFVALVMLFSGGADVDRTDILFTGTHSIAATPGAVIVAGGDAVLDGGDAVTQEVFVIGGELRLLAGSEVTMLTQLGGTLRADEGAVIGHLRAYGGDQSIDDGVTIGTRTTLETETTDRGSATPIPTILGTVALASIAAWMTNRRQPVLDNLADAAGDHPVVSLAVGTTLILTGIALIVFMAFTLILIPLSIAAAFLGVAVLALGVVAWGHRVGRSIPRVRRPIATGLGVALVIGGMWLVGMVPVIGDALVLMVLVTGFGAAIISLLGYRRFEPPSLPG